MSEQIQVLITLPLEEEQIAELEEISEQLSITHLPTQGGAAIPEEVWENTDVGKRNSPRKTYSGRQESSIQIPFNA